jgi:hypothetical protein
MLVLPLVFRSPHVALATSHTHRGGKPPAAAQSNMQVGAAVTLGHFGNGILRYLGADKVNPSADVVVCGVELDLPDGSGDGTYDGVRYFTCAPKHGVTFPMGNISMTMQ